MAALAPPLPPLLDFSKNPVQEEFVFWPGRRVAYAGAIRSGKTVGGGARLLFLADLMPGSRFLVGRKDYNDLFNTTLKEVLPFIAQLNGGEWRVPGPRVVRYDGEFHDLYLRTKGEPSVLHFRHLKEIGKQLGVETSGYFIDQLEEVDEEVYSHIHSRMTWWNEQRREKFKKKYGFYPQAFETLAMNPDPGWTKSFLFDQDNKDSPYYRSEEDRFKFFQATAEQNRANLPPGWIEEMRRTHTKSWVKRFLEGDYNIRGGAVYEDFFEDLHVIDEFRIPSHWQRFISLDWGYSHYCAVYWLAVDENGTIYVYDEYYDKGKLVSQVAKVIHEKTRKHTAAPKADGDGGLLVWMDPSTDQHHGVVERSIMGEFREHKIYGMKANNDVPAGINKVAERLKHESEPEDGSPPILPTLYFFRNRCPNLVREMKLYVWQPPNAQGISSGRPVKKDDDGPDSLRYGVMAVLETISSGAPPRPKKDDDFGNYVLNQFLLKDDNG